MWSSSPAKTRIRLIAVMAIAGVLTNIAGCGYAIRKPGEIKLVRIGNIGNMTTEPALAETLINSLAQELSRQGIAIATNADYAITGSLGTFDVRSTAEQGGVTVQYEVTVSGEFFITYPDGRTTRLATGHSFIVTYGSTGPMAELEAQRHAAVSRAASNMAQRIAAAVVYLR